MTSLCFGRYGREDNTLIVTTRGRGSDLVRVLELGVEGTDPGNEEEVGVKHGWAWV